MPSILTGILWCFTVFAHEAAAVLMISYILCNKRGPCSGLAISSHLKRYSSCTRSDPAGVTPTLATTLDRGVMARRASTMQVLGHIIAPIVCVFPILFDSFIRRVRSDSTIPLVVLLIAIGLVGTFNMALVGLDRSIVAAVFWPYWKKREEERIWKQKTTPCPSSSLLDVQATGFGRVRNGRSDDHHIQL